MSIEYGRAVARRDLVKVLIQTWVDVVLYYCKVLGKFFGDYRDKIKFTETKFLALTGWYCIVDNGIGLPASQRSPAGPVRQPNAMIVYIRGPKTFPLHISEVFSRSKRLTQSHEKMSLRTVEHWMLGKGQESIPRNRFQGIDSASLCSLAGRYDNIPTRFRAPTE